MRTRVAIVFGGKSGEHEVSLQSAKSIFDALDKTKYEPLFRSDLHRPVRPSSLGGRGCGRHRA